MAHLVHRTLLVLIAASLAGGFACSSQSEGSPATEEKPDPSLESKNEGYGQQLIGYKNAKGNAAEGADYDSMAPGAYSGAAAMGGTSSTGGYPASIGGSGPAGGTPMIGGSAGEGGAVGVAGSLGDAGSAGSDGEAGSAGASLEGPPLSPQADLPPPGGVVENPFFAAAEAPLSTFSIDVDSGSFTLARAAIRDGVRPDPESVRVEEFLNYFHFHYAEPEGDEPLALYTELGACPWNPSHELLLLGVQGQEVAIEDQPPANLVYLLDVSGSMSSPDKLPLLKRGFRMLTRQLRPQDKVSIVTYAGRESVVLDGVGGDQKATIDAALAALESGGSTNGAGGIQKAYELAQKHYLDGGTNRVLLATDGDFNVGLSGVEELTAFIAEKRDTGVFLSVYGFGSAWNGGNFQDEVTEQLADNGNGVYFFIDGEEEARRAFIHTISGSLITVAKDVKLQVAFNPEQVRGYRLIGYENRLLANDDFSNDSVDAGELGASMSVTALYEIVPAGSSGALPAPLPGTIPEVPEASPGTEPEPEYPAMAPRDLAQIRIRYKNSDSDVSQLLVATRDRSIHRDDSSLKFLFAAGVSEFAMGLRGSQYLPRGRGELIRRQIEAALPIDAEGAVAEMGGLVGDALTLQ